MMISQDLNNMRQWQQDQTLENALRVLLQDRIYVTESFLGQINILLKQYSEDVYPVILYMLTHKNFEKNDAHRYWDDILSLHQDMSSKLNMVESLDLRVAVLNYFLRNDYKDTFEKLALVDLVFFEKVQESAYKDELTGLFNYRYLKEHLPQELLRATRYGSMVSVIMLDIDDFKYYNDNHGHEAGNQVLIRFAEILNDNVRSIDTVIRYGGEEFILLLTATNKEGALVVYDRIQRSLKTASIPKEKQQPLGIISASAGIATYPSDAEAAGELIQNADNAMYIAKKSGKNRAHIFGENRRSHKRLHAKLRGNYSLGHPGEKFPLTTIDVSEGGLLVLINESVPDGALLDVQVNLVDSGGPLVFPARVVHVEKSEDGKYHIGLRIVEMPSQDRIRLQSLIHELDHK